MELTTKTFPQVNLVTAAQNFVTAAQNLATVCEITQDAKVMRSVQKLCTPPESLTKSRALRTSFTRQPWLRCE